MSKKKKKLNVVYFIDSEKTRSLSVSLSKLNLIIGFVAVTLLWALMSTVGIVYLSNNYLNQELKLISAKETIFEFQSRYNKVYEIAYPDKIKSVSEPEIVSRIPESHSELADIELESNNISNETELSPDSKEDVDATKNIAKNSDESITAAKDTQVKDSEKNAKRTLEDFKLVVESAKVIPAKETYDLNFVMNNYNKNQRERGYVWAVAKIRKNDNSIVYIPAPEYIQLDENGKPLNRKRSHQYSLKNYKSTRFVLKLPEGLEGKFESLNVGIMSDDDLIKEFTFPSSLGIQKESKPAEKLMERQEKEISKSELAPKVQEQSTSEQRNDEKKKIKTSKSDENENTNTQL